MKTTPPSDAASTSLLPAPGWVPDVGDVINYAYLWRQEFKAGKIDGAKDRPCLVIVSELRGNQTRIIVAPITSQSFRGSATFKVPPPFIDAMGLNPTSVIIASDLNAFFWVSPDVRMRGKNHTHYGRLSDNITRAVLEQAKRLGVRVTMRSI